MEVDLTMPPSSAKKRSSTSLSSTVKRARLTLPEDQLTTLKDNMKESSARSSWQPRIMLAMVDSRSWLGLFSDVLMNITQELAATGIRGSVIACPSMRRANEIVESFNKDELEEWKAAVQNGVEKGDWTDLIEHRMYILDYHIVGSCIIVTLAKLKNTLPPNESLGVPIDQRTVHYCYLLFCCDIYHMPS